MEILLTHESALAFWRNNLSVAHDALGRRSHASTHAPASLPGFDVSCIASAAGLPSGDIHVLVSQSGYRRLRLGLKVHVRSESLPWSCVCRVAEIDGLQVWVVSPEMCLVHLASQAGVCGALALSYEFCGRYRRKSALAGGSTLYDVFPLASAQSIARTVDRLGSSGESRPLRWVLSHTLDGAMSPQESALAILLAMPVSMGGYGLPAPVLNATLDASGIAHSLARGRRIICDLCWPDQRVSIEYDSAQEHSGSERMMHDAVRYNLLKSLGYTTFMATWNQLRSVEETDRIAFALAKALGVRLRLRAACFREKQRELRSVLYL